MYERWREFFGVGCRGTLMKMDLRTDNIVFQGYNNRIERLSFFFSSARGIESLYR